MKSKVHKHALQLVYVPTTTLGLVAVEAFAVPFTIAALIVAIILGLAMAVIG